MKKAKPEYPFTFTASQKPAGHKGRRCRILGKGMVAEVVWVEFKGGGKYLVARRSLARQ